MIRQLLDTVRVGRLTGRQASDDAPDGRRADPDRDEVARETADPTRVQTPRTTAANASADTRYPLSWPARDLARSRRLPPRNDDATIMVDGARADRSRSGSPRK